MKFDEKAYGDFLKSGGALSADLLERYAITLPASDAEIAVQIKTVFAYWNKKSTRGQGTLAERAKACMAAHEKLKTEKGFETAEWWQGKQRARDAEVRKGISELASVLKDDNRLGVVTAAALEKTAASMGLTESHAMQAVAQAELTVIPASVALPGEWPLKTSYDELDRYLRDGDAKSVPGLIHPDAKPFCILERYECVGDPEKRLDLRAIEDQEKEVGKNKTDSSTARASALTMLKNAKSKKDDAKISDILWEVALYHLMKQVEGVSPTSGRQQLVDRGVEPGDAAKIVVLLASREKAAKKSGLDRVTDLIAEGQLGKAKSEAGKLAGDKEVHDQALQVIAGKEQELTGLKARVAEALRQPDEALAHTLVREMYRISKDDADRELRMLPLPPAAQARVARDGRQVKVFWGPGIDHDESTVYSVRRKTGQAPAAATDGDEVHLGPGTECADPGAPVAVPVKYGIFALAGEGRPASRPVTAEMTLVPPVWDVRHKVGSDMVTLSWAAHQDAEVEVTRAQGVGGSQLPVPVTGNGCQVTGLPEGVTQYFEITAVYRGPGGSTVTSKPEQVKLRPLGSAKPNPTLRVTTVESDGQIRARLTWRSIDSSEVQILRTDTEPPWPEGTFVTREEVQRAGQLLTDRVDAQGAECAMETGLASGIHYLTPLSTGGTGTVVGKPKSIAMISPVRNLVFTSFADYATLAWEWPENVRMAEVRWRSDEEQDWDFTVLTLNEYQSGGVKVPLGAKPVKVEVCALIPVGTRHHPSPPASIEVPRVLKVAIRYQVSGGALTGRSRKVTFTADDPCSGVRVRMIASEGGIMPTKPVSGQVTVLETTLDLAPGVPVEHKVSIPKMRKPYWVRCFILDGPGRLIDPPYKNLKEN